MRTALSASEGESPALSEILNRLLASPPCKGKTPEKHAERDAYGRIQG